MNILLILVTDWMKSFFFLKETILQIIEIFETRKQSTGNKNKNKGKTAK